MEYGNENVQSIRQIFDISTYFIIYETHAESTECEIQSPPSIEIWKIGMEIFFSYRLSD